MIDICDQILKRETRLTETEILNCSGYWIPLHWLYVEMVKNNGIPPIAEMGQTDKHRLWNLTEGKRWKRVCQVTALYVYDQLKNNVETTTS